MGLFRVNWKMTDPSDTEVLMEIEGDSTDAINILVSRKDIIEKAIERGWGLAKSGTTKPVGPPTNNGSFGQAAPSCQHGQRKWKEGTSRKSGKPYKGWFCPADQCPPNFIADKGRRSYGDEPPEYGEYR